MNKSEKSNNVNGILPILSAGLISAFSGVIAYEYPNFEHNYRNFSTHNTTQPTQSTLMNRTLREVGVRTLPLGEFSIIYIPPVHRDGIYVYNSKNKSTCISPLSENTSLREFMSDWDKYINSLDCLPLTDSKEDLKVEGAIRKVGNDLEKRISIHF